MTIKPNLRLIDNLGFEDISAICDHTFLNRSEMYKQIAEKGESPVKLRLDAFNSFMNNSVSNAKMLPYAICVRPEDVKNTTNYLNKHEYKNILVASVVGFPDGSLYDTAFKVFETEFAIKNGAQEIDMVLNYEKFQSGDIFYTKKDIMNVVYAAHNKDALVKLIFETSELSSEEIKDVCDIANEAEVDFIKTSTGFAAYGAKPDDLKIMRENFSGGIKISGGVNIYNVSDLLFAASGRDDGYIDMNPQKIRIGESSLLSKL